MVIENGEDTNIWCDPWIADKPAIPVKALKGAHLHHQQIVLRCKIMLKILSTRKVMSGILLREILDEENFRNMEKIRPGRPNCKDTYSWDGYWVAVNILSNKDKDIVVEKPSIEELEKAFWKKDVSPRIQHFMWSCLSDCLLV